MFTVDAGGEASLAKSFFMEETFISVDGTGFNFW